MRVLCVNSVISEFGGVELAAMNLARGLAERQHEVHFLAARDQQSRFEPRAQSRSDYEDAGEKIRKHYRRFPRTYPLGERHGTFRKLIWHIQDLAHPTNERLFKGVLKEVNPDVVLLHNITAVGINIWRPIRQLRIPCIQVVHDLSLICFNMARYRSGRQCSSLCAACRFQKAFRFSLIGGSRDFAFVSPSAATLQNTEQYVSLAKWKTAVIHNAANFIVKPRHSNNGMARLLYVGRLDPPKGLEMMLRAARRAHEAVSFDLDILGTGSIEQSLRREYVDCSWVRFHGVVDQNGVAEFMSRATVLLVPSVWLETVPLVAVHALFAGLPVLGSRIGGIPEHVEDYRTGRLLPPGDEEAWAAEIIQVVNDHRPIAAWSAGCLKFAQKFSPGLAIEKYERLMEEMVKDADARKDIK
jgi:glycosyltransferase involved in cell wall biosynthesis